MDLRWLEDILILLEEGNLTRAAERRAITQPAFSRRIRAFENWLGQDILDRKVNRVRIRDSARNSEPEIRALIQRLKELQQKMRLIDAGQKRLTITAQHALALSMFSDLMTLVNTEIEPMTYRLKTANRSDCISTFIRGDADILLCYEAENDPKMPFDDTFLHMTWGTDRLVPVVGGALRYSLKTSGSPSEPIPVITFPEHSYFGQALSASSHKNMEHDPKFKTICETAFSAGVREMALNGVGLAWIPMSLVSREIEAGKLSNLSNLYGSVSLKISLYARPEGDLNKTIIRDLKLLRGTLG